MVSHQQFSLLGKVSCLIVASSALSIGNLLSAFPVMAAQEVYLGKEIDQCSGDLRVKNKNGQSIFVPRGHWTIIDVAIDGDGYWRWKCGNTPEKSRGDANFRQRVKRLRVWHSTSSRKIIWSCFDLLP